MRVILPKHEQEGGIRSMQDLEQKVLVYKGLRTSDWIVSKVYSSKRKIEPGSIDLTKFSFDKREVEGKHGDGYLATLPLIIADGELFMKRYSNDKLVPCTKFPLGWHELDGALEVHLEPPVASTDSFEVTIHTLTGKTCSITTSPLETVDEITTKIQSSEGIPISQQRIIFEDRQLESGYTLTEYGIRDGSTLHLVLRLRGGMYHPSSARFGLDRLGELPEGASKFVKIKYGPGDGDEFELELNDGETRESLMERANERVASIKVLEDQISMIKRGAVPEEPLPKKKQKTNRGDDGGEDSKEKTIKQDCCGALPSNDIVIKMLKRENELRLSEDVQRRFEEAERSGSKTDWIEVASQLQKEVLKEFNVSESALHAYRAAANKHEISLYVKYNRAREGGLQVGSKAPDVPLVSIEEDGSTCSESLLQLQQRDRPLVVIAGSLSCPPARYIVPAMYRDFAKTGGEFSNNNDFAFLYIEEAHACDEWPIRSSRYMPNGEVVNVKQPRLVSERVALAQGFADKFGLGPEMKVLVDDPEQENPFEKAYAPWPIRIYVIENGVMQYISAPTDCAHDVSELRAWLKQRHSHSN